MIGVLLLFAQMGAVQFETRVVPDTVYVGQQVTYDAITLVDDATRARLKANPEYTPADVSGATVYDFPFDTAAISDVMVDGTGYRRYLYRRALFPLTAGTYEVPAATLRYTVPADGDFNPARAVTLSSYPNSFVALPLPASGRPIGFTGAVGSLRDTLWTDGTSARVGDTFMATMRIAGVGNLNLLPRPSLQIDWATVVPGDERVAWDSTGSVVRGTKEFDWVVTPKFVGDLSIPPVRYNFFNPTSGRYEVAATSLLPVIVVAAGAVPADTVRHVPDQIGDSPFPVLLRLARANALAVGIGASVLVVVLLVILFAGRGRPSDTEDE